MKEIGGYFELELNRRKEYHQNAIKLNLGRTAFEYVIRAKKVQKVFLPYYICESMLEPILKTGIEFEFYHIDTNLEPIFNFATIKEGDFILYCNYYGIKDIYLETLIKKAPDLIIDNSQSFFSKAYSGKDTIYSPRKFFGVPDGGYLYTNQEIIYEIQKDNSLDRIEHLAGRLEGDVERYFPVFRANEQKLNGQPIKRMSNFTSRLLQNINYRHAAKTRQRNFRYLSSRLGSRNQMKFDINSESVPMVYPFYSDKLSLKDILIENKIFVPTYWEDVRGRVSQNTIEFKLISNLTALPVDQRYDLGDMRIIANLILRYV